MPITKTADRWRPGTGTTALRDDLTGSNATRQRVTWFTRNQMRIAPAVFLLPAMLLFAVYVIYPILQSFWVSFHEWDGLTPDMEFVGLGNYMELFGFDWELLGILVDDGESYWRALVESANDQDFWRAIINNVFWLTLFMLAPVFGLAIALFLNQTVFGIRLIKSLFFFPFVISQVVVGLVFSWFYDPANGLLNAIFGSFGVPQFSILSSESAVTFGIIAAGLWPQTAYCMILYLTGLNNINAEQIEAARIDGAKGWSLLSNVILPQLRPATFLAVVITVIGALRSFDLVAIMTAGGPFGSSTVLAFKMYEEALFNYRQGYGAAVAVVLFLIMSVYIAFFLTRMVRQER